MARDWIVRLLRQLPARVMNWTATNVGLIALMHYPKKHDLWLISMTQNRVLWSFSKVCKINIGDEGEKSRSIKRLSKAEIKSSSIYQIIKLTNRVDVCVLPMILQKARSLACLLKDESTPFVKKRWKISSLSKKRQGFRAVFLCALKIQETKRRNSKNNLICGCEIEKREKGLINVIG